MTETTPEVPTSSELAEQMYAAGARPTDVNIEAMMAQMAKLQDAVDRMNAERGVPLDRVAGYRQQLKEHVKVRMNARPDVDWFSLESRIGTLPENADHLTARDTEALHFEIERLVKQHPGKELDYLEILAGELHQTVLDREGGDSATHLRIQALEDQIKALAAKVDGSANVVNHG